MSAAEVTQTGQPGPEIKRRLEERQSRRPKRAMAKVWLPQISIIVTGRPILFIRPSRVDSNPRDNSGSRYSSIYFIVYKFLEKLEFILGEVRVDAMDGISGVTDDIISDFGFFIDDIEADVPADVTNFDYRHVVFSDGNNLSRKTDAHKFY
jgi:hypothetical protein